MKVSPTDFEYISKMVRAKAAIVLEPGKEYLVESRMIPLIHREGLESIEELVKKLRSNTSDSLANKVIEAMTTNETSFFRDSKPHIH